MVFKGIVLPKEEEKRVENQIYGSVEIEENKIFVAIVVLIILALIIAWAYYGSS